MSKILNHIKEINNTFLDKIINVIKDDNEWLIKLCISESELHKRKLITDLISKYLSNPENLKTIDMLLRYVISDFLDDDDHLPLIKHVVSADGYGRKSALFVFKCSELYFCYFTGDEIKTLITSEPEAFCWEAAKSILAIYETEKESLKDDWFNDSNTYNELTLNYNFD